MVPPGVMICLITGAVLIAAPPRRNFLWLTAVGGVFTLVGLLAPLWSEPTIPGVWQIGWWAAAAWWLGSAWTSQETPEGFRTSSHALGWSILAAGGLLLAAVAEDWVLLGLALEIVRLATQPSRGHDAAHIVAVETGEPSSLWAYGLAVVGWVSITGAARIDEWRAVLQGSYGLSDTAAPLGRASLVLVGATVLTVFAVCSPVLWSWRVVSGADERTSVGQKLAMTGARQLAALLILSRLMSGGTPGLDGIWIVCLVLMSGLAWVVAWRWLTDRQRFDRVMLGLSQFQWGCLLVWLCAVQGRSPSAGDAGELISSVAAQESCLVAAIVSTATLAAIAASTAGLVTPRDGNYYLDQFRGLATVQPWRAALLLVPLTSLVGLPWVAGFWVRVSWLIALLGVHQIDADDVIIPHRTLRMATVMAILALAVASNAVFRVARLMLLEPAVRWDAPQQRWWPASVAVLTTIALFLLGMAPGFLL